MDSNTIKEKFPHLTDQALEATGKTDPAEAIEAMLAAQAAQAVQDAQGVQDAQPTPYTIEAAYSQLNANDRAAVKELAEYLIATRQNGRAAE